MTNLVFSRRNMILSAAGAAAAGVLGRAVPAAAQAAAAVTVDGPIVKNGRINQGVCMGAVRGMKLEQAAPLVAKMGLKCIDLQGPGSFATLKQHGLVGSITPSHSLSDGLSHKENHEKCLASIRKSIDATSEAGFPNVICFSGNRKGMSDEEGMKNCVEALKQVAGYAEEKKVTLCMELLNSKVNHKDYMCDHVAWGAAMCKAVGSERVKLLYDIYHMQVQEGDIIASIKQFNQYIGHYHTAGVPGRNEIDDSQELYYPPIMQAIVATGYKGFVSHEYSPKKDMLTSLIQAVKTCDV